MNFNLLSTRFLKLEIMRQKRQESLILSKEQESLILSFSSGLVIKGENGRKITPYI